MTAAEAREKALAAITEARADHESGPLFADFAAYFQRRQGRRWKPSTRTGNAHLIERRLVPFFGAMHVAGIDRADVRRWFDSLSGAPGSANRTLPVLSVMMRQAELWDLRSQGYNPCRNMRRYRTVPREGRFIFPNRKGGGPMTDLGFRWQKLRGLAAHAVMSGLDLYTVGRLLGHADAASTERYAHLADEHVREAAGRISGIVHEAMTGKGSGR